MQVISQLLGGFGFLGIVAGALLGFVVLLVLPWCAIVECVRSDRSANVKAFLVLALVFTWGLGSLVYGILVTRSRPLRIFTLVGVALPLLVLVPSVISFGTGLGLAAELQEEASRAEIEELVASFRPGLLAADAVAPFHALHFVHDGMAPRAAALSRFTLDGPIDDTARDVDDTVRHVACDPATGRCFAVTDHDFGTISPSTGRFSRIEVDPSLDEFAWPSGLAWDPDEGKVIVVTSHVYTRFYRYDPATSDWERLPSEIRGLPVVGLAYSPDDHGLYALEREEAAGLALRSIHRFNTAGAGLGSIPIEPPIPISPERGDLFQLHHSSGKLVLILPPFDFEGQGMPDATAGAAASRILAVDPSSGGVFVAQSPSSDSEGLNES